MKKPKKKNQKQNPNRKEGLDALEKALNLLGWTFALIDTGNESDNTSGMAIGTKDFLEALSKDDSGTMG